METLKKLSGTTPVDQANFIHCADVIKQKAGLASKKSLPIKELIRRGSYSAVVVPDLYCETLNKWPMKDQLDFLHSIATLSEPEKIVHVYEKAYELCRDSWTKMDNN